MASRTSSREAVGFLYGNMPMIYGHGVVIRSVWVDVRVSESPSPSPVSWEDITETDSSPSPGSGEETAMRRTDRARERPDDADV